MMKNLYPLKKRAFRVALVTLLFCVAGVTNLKAQIPQGAINSLFVINENGDRVCFSQGNLQYQASSDTWRFAENQWDYSLADPTNFTDSNGWIDLFGWEQTDWGWNAISNGGNQVNSGWRTLTHEEWNYVLNLRPFYPRYAKAQVNNVKGLILLPDEWDPDFYPFNYPDIPDCDFTINTISSSQWSTLEQNGAVFLPAASHMYVTYSESIGSRGYYWSTSYYDEEYSWGVYFSDSYVNADDFYPRVDGLSVRLVRPDGPDPQPQPTGVVIKLAPGWNWISNLLTTDTNLEEALVNLTPNNGDLIKSPNSFSTFNAAEGRWEGALSTMSPGKGYIYLRNGESTSFSYPAEENPGSSFHRPFVMPGDLPMEVSAHEATINYRVISTDDAPVIVRGVCWSTHPDPNVEDDHTFDGYGYGMYTSYLTNLMPNTEYYVRGYAVTPNGVGYSNLAYFTTLSHVVHVFYSCSETCGSVQASAGGNIYTQGQPCVLMAGESCTLTAFPNPGYSFSGWYIGNELVSTDASYTFTVYDDCFIVAVFSGIEYSIIPSWTPDTLVSAITVSPNEAYVGQTVNIYYSRPEGFILKNLVVKTSTYNILILTIINNYCTVEMPADNITVTGTYQEIVVEDIGDFHQYEYIPIIPSVTSVGNLIPTYVFIDPQGETHYWTWYELMDYTFDIVGEWHYYVRYQNQYGYFITQTKQFQVLP